VQEVKRLYHGSKNGIKGDIKPESRERCDFGCGFYLGDKPDQPKGLIAQRSNNPRLDAEMMTPISSPSGT